MNINDVEEMEMLIKLKNKAKELFEEISTKQKLPLFPDSKGRYVVWNDGNNKHYFTKENDNIYWVADYLHQFYKVEVSENGIFNMLLDAYNFKKEHKNSCLVNSSEDAMKYFESYVKYSIK